MPGRGYPYNVTLSNNTILNYPFSGNVARTVQEISKLMRILFIYDYVMPPALSAALTIASNISIDSNLSLGDAFGGDLNVGGNWKRTGILQI